MRHIQLSNEKLDHIQQLLSGNVSYYDGNGLDAIIDVDELRYQSEENTLLEQLNEHIDIENSDTYIRVEKG